ncbi:hypothetical protein [Methylobacter sp.]|uniref:hypothetical protein n=1 Tax=Methylobacter sp. TaxID=2051955 RepID=UPI003DA4319B
MPPSSNENPIDAVRTLPHPTALWLVGLSLKGSATERQIRVNSGQQRSPYSVVFLGRIACRYTSFELSVAYWELAQAQLISYFDTLEEE